jgi:hypothetical protein
MKDLYVQFMKDKIASLSHLPAVIDVADVDHSMENNDHTGTLPSTPSLSLSLSLSNKHY